MNEVEALLSATLDHMETRMAREPETQRAVAAMLAQDHTPMVVRPLRDLLLGEAVLVIRRRPDIEHA